MSVRGRRARCRVSHRSLVDTQAREAREAAASSASAKASGKSAKVDPAAPKTVNARAERIAARKAAGVEAPTLFGL